MTETANAAEASAHNTFGQFEALATTITSEAQINNHKNGDEEYSFPYMNVPHFDRRSQEISDRTGAEMIMFVPFASMNSKMSSEVTTEK